MRGTRPSPSECIPICTFVLSTQLHPYTSSATGGYAVRQRVLYPADAPFIRVHTLRPSFSVKGERSVRWQLCCDFSSSRRLKRRVTDEIDRKSTSLGTGALRRSFLSFVRSTVIHSQTWQEPTTARDITGPWPLQLPESDYSFGECNVPQCQSETAGQGRQVGKTSAEHTTHPDCCTLELKY